MATIEDGLNGLKGDAESLVATDANASEVDLSSANVSTTMGEAGDRRAEVAGDETPSLLPVAQLSTIAVGEDLTSRVEFGQGDAVALLALNPSSSVGTPQPGTISFGSEQDIFPITLTGSESYIFDVTGGTLRDPTLSLHDASGTRLVFDDDGGPGLNSRIEYTVGTGGTYYLNVGSYREGTGTYTLTSRADDAADDIYTRDSVVPDEWRFGTINSGDDQDYYSIWLNQGQAYTFDLYRNGLSDPTLAIRDSAGTQLRYNDDFGGTLDSHIDFTAPHTGYYYLDVGSYSSYTGGYLLVA